MASGSKTTLKDYNTGDLARVVNGRLLVSTVGGGGPTADVNIASIGGNAVTTTIPVSGTVAVTQSTSPWVVSGTVGISGSVSVTQGTTPWTVDGTVAVTQSTSPWVVSGTVGISGTVAVTQSTSPWVVSGTVAATQSGAWTVAVSGTVAVTQSTSPWVVSGTVAATQSGAWSVGITGTVAVTQSTSPWVVGQSTHASLLAQIRVQDGNGSNLMDVVTDGEAAVPEVPQFGIIPMFNGVAAEGFATADQWGRGCISEAGRILVDIGYDSTGVRTFNPGTLKFALGKAEDAVAADGDTGVMVLAVRQDSLSSSVSASGDYGTFKLDSVGALWINAGTAAASLGKAEDAVAANGDTGVMVLAVRQDTLSSSVSANGDYGTFKLNSVGALWVKESGVATVVLSGSTRGRPILITATASTGTTIHTATTTSGQLDRIFIDLENTSTAAVLVTIEFGTTGASSELKFIVPAQASIRAIDGAVLGGAATDTVTAYAATGSVIKATGRVERLS